MVTHLGASLRLVAVSVVLLGLAYPAAGTVLAQALFPAAASGSWVQDDRGNVVGSRLLAQPFQAPHHFHPRPSASGHNPRASGGSNLGPTSARLKARVAETAQQLGPPAVGARWPVDAVTASASGLDPHISPANARLQAVRVAAARHVEVQRVLALVEEHVEGPDLGFLGDPRVNVLVLNMALDRRFGAVPP